MRLLTNFLKRMTTELEQETRQRYEHVCDDSIVRLCSSTLITMIPVLVDSCPCCVLFNGLQDKDRSRIRTVG